MHPESGVTRDRIVAPSQWKGGTFQLIDTGGLGLFGGERKKAGEWDIPIRQQVDTAVESADALIFATDVLDGVTPLDHEIAKSLRRSGVPVFLVVNKVDNAKQEEQAEVFMELGFDKILCVSSLHRRGIREVLEAIFAEIPAPEPLGGADQRFKIAVAGRPNVGKSSLVNALFGMDRVLVSEKAGTTRDAIDIECEFTSEAETLPVTLIDTAGLRKKSKVDGAIEKYSVIRAEDSLKRAQLILFVVEASGEGVTAQDRRVAQTIQDSKKGCVIVANKWDACSSRKKDSVEKEIRHTMPFMGYAPVIFCSAKENLDLDKVVDAAMEVRKQMSVGANTALVNQVIADATTHYSAPVVKNKPFKIYYGTMASGNPPRFILFVNDPKLCAPSYLNYLNNYFRKSFDLTGLPIQITLRARKRK